tara:strand:- start:1248 stop:1601 length:354 start_codon:yes stop_codon:yes gene_type:complete
MTEQKMISDVEKALGVDELETELYNSSGNKTEEENLSAAKIVKFSAGNRYYIKTGGRPTVSYNPIIDDLATTDSRHRGKELLFKYEEVDNGLFEQYVEFLKTKNTYLLNQVETLRKR